MKVLVIGTGAAGLTTASTIRKYNSDIEITVLTQENYIAYSPCAIPYVIGKEIKDFKTIVMHEPEDYAKKNVEILINSEVVDINADEKTVVYKKADEINEIKYDKLVLATGGTPFIPPIEGVNSKGVFKVRTIQDGMDIQNYINKNGVKKVVVAGAGAIGMEMAYCLKEIGIDVSVIEMVPQIFPRALDPDMAKIVQNYLEEENTSEDAKLNIILEKPVGKIIADDNGAVCGVMVGEETLEAQMVIMSTGVRSNIALAQKAGCKIGRWAVLTDEIMETSVADVYAVGDCVEVVDAITGEQTLSPFGTTAVRQAKVVGKNIAKLENAPVSKPVLNSNVTKIGKLEIAGTGMSEIGAGMNNIEVITTITKSASRARYYPGGKPIYIKLIVKKDDNRVIGCQAIGEERVTERIDAMSIAISKGVTVEELANMEFSYAPPVSMVVDPLFLAAENTVEKIKKENQ
ncbi:NADH oxidase (H2O2-forming) [Methanococcus voltae]|uniref:NADH oxidase (H2O2-forming) n=2 Tax=Methanococcus voltae TaxID=2188 RepID=A0A8J7S4C5_METVO|nr:FAD-dependent oxidoreductase [Methanococcus voltae]MBP2201153.1 NADH oxidase (H2O2-forming) [Methanococcus voltae]MCS3921876.1 NADH oxidase (H2O2-forming) [Methanococcus voltae PS]